MKQWLISLMSYPILFSTLVAVGLVFPSLPHAGGSDGIFLVQADSIRVSNAWARASAGGAMAGAVYITVTGGAQPDQLIGASTPVAAKAEAHESFTDNGVMKMRPAPGVAIPAGKDVTFSPGGYHIMLMGLKQPLRSGESFPLTLSFAHAPPVTVDVQVQPLGRAKPADNHDMHSQ